MLPRILQPAHIVRRVQVRVDQFDQAVQVFDRHGIIFLVKIVDVAVEDLDEKFYRHRSVHAGVGDTKSPLEAL